MKICRRYTEENEPGITETVRENLERAAETTKRQLEKGRYERDHIEWANTFGQSCTEGLTNRGKRPESYSLYIRDRIELREKTERVLD